jgi:hypothetical protein
VFSVLDEDVVGNQQPIPNNYKVSRNFRYGGEYQFSCECEYAATMRLPCRHVIYKIEKSALCLFKNFDYPRRWLKMSPLAPEESSSDSATSTFDSYGTEQSASDTNFVQLAPDAQLRRVKVVDRFNSIKVHTDLIMSMLTDKSRFRRKRQVLQRAGFHQQALIIK